MKYIILGVLNAASAIVFAVFFLISSVIKDALPSQQARDRWAGGSAGYAQVSFFIDKDRALSSRDILMFRSNLDEKLEEYAKPQDNPNASAARVYADAYSTDEAGLSVTSDRSTVSATVIGTGGDYFIFHPLKMKAGYYYSDADTQADTAVIDEDLAWQLFGSSDVCGMRVLIGGRSFYISGVSMREDDFFSKKVYGERPRMYIPYEGFAAVSPSAAVTCYEVCLPSPVKGLGMETASESVSLQEDDVIAVENSDRYSFERLWDFATSFGMRSVFSGGVSFPYWENAARITEDYMTVLFAVLLISLITPLLTLLYLGLKLIKNRKAAFNKLLGLFKLVSGKIKDLRFKNERTIIK